MRLPLGVARLIGRAGRLGHLGTYLNVDAEFKAAGLRRMAEIEGLGMDILRTWWGRRGKGAHTGNIHSYLEQMICGYGGLLFFANYLVWQRANLIRGEPSRRRSISFFVKKKKKVGEVGERVQQFDSGRAKARDRLGSKKKVKTSIDRPPDICGICPWIIGNRTAPNLM